MSAIQIACLLTAVLGGCIFLSLLSKQMDVLAEQRKIRRWEENREAEIKRSVEEQRERHRDPAVVTGGPQLN